eukprot:TRINITY_DN21681_c0_g1_i2.p1 TRINITY_DN21681_c0_g1~~TRINITY_DN21681_c0_g1_i2.p1  ORF type:complete len:1728 (+),score=201.73 TRINITY_DN21681_c0_g1_i2:776-5185(+)
MQDCGSFSCPSGYKLRPHPFLLICGSVCNPVDDVDFCCSSLIGTRSFSMDGSPAEALIQSNWSDGGCLTGIATPGQVTNMKLTLQLEYYKMSAWLTSTGNLEPYGQLTVDGKNLFVINFNQRASGDSPLMVRSGSKIEFDYNGEGFVAVNWTFCLRGSCDDFDCAQHGLVNQKGEWCQWYECTADDLEVCCSAEETIEENGPLSGLALNPVFDVTLPESRMAMNAINAIFDQSAARTLVCTELIDRNPTSFCDFYVSFAKEIGFEVPLPVLRPAPDSYATAARKLSVTLSHVILVCTRELTSMIAFINAMRTSIVEAQFIVSCLPFGDILRENAGYIADYMVEPIPWPAPQVLFKAAKTNDDSTRQALYTAPSFDTVYWSEVETFGNFEINVLLLRSAFHILAEVYELIMGVYTTALVLLEDADASSANLPRDTSTHPARLALSGRTFFEGYPMSVDTYMGTITFDPKTGYRSHVSSANSATRQFTPLERADNFDLDPKQTWAYTQARLAFANIHLVEAKAKGIRPMLIAKSFTNKLEVSKLSGVKFIESYPCTSRDAETFRCEPCTDKPPGSPDIAFYADRYAAETCFPCPEEAICEDARKSPKAKPGYYRILNESYDATYGDLLQKSACIAGPEGGLWTVSSQKMERWFGSKENYRWQFTKCNPPGICLGDNKCKNLHEGRLCMGCRVGSSKLSLHMGSGACQECPGQAVIFLLAVMVAVFHFTLTYMLQRATLETALTKYSFSATEVFTLVLRFQMMALTAEIAGLEFPKLTFPNPLLPGDLLIKPGKVILSDCVLGSMSTVDGIRAQVQVVTFAFMAGYALIGIITLCRRRFSVLAFQDGIRYFTAFTVVSGPAVLYSHVAFSLSCDFLVGTPTLKISKSIPCGDGTWFVNLFVPGIISAGFVAAIYALMVFALWQKRADRASLACRRQYCLLFCNVKERCHMWRSLDLLRPYGAVMCSLLPYPGSIFMLAASEIFYMSLIKSLRPFTYQNGAMVYKIFQTSGFSTLALILVRFTFVQELAETLVAFVTLVTLSQTLQSWMQRSAMRSARDRACETDLGRFAKRLVALEQQLTGFAFMECDFMEHGLRIDTAKLSYADRMTLINALDTAWTLCFYRGTSLFMLNDGSQLVSQSMTNIGHAHRCLYNTGIHHAMSNAFNYDDDGGRRPRVLWPVSELVSPDQMLVKLSVASRTMLADELLCAVEEYAEDHFLRVESRAGRTKRRRRQRTKHQAKAIADDENQLGKQEETKQNVKVVIWEKNRGKGQKGNSHSAQQGDESSDTPSSSAADLHRTLLPEISLEEDEQHAWRSMVLRCIDELGLLEEKARKIVEYKTGEVHSAPVHESLMGIRNITASMVALTDFSLKLHPSGDDEGVIDLDVLHHDLVESRKTMRETVQDEDQKDLVIIGAEEDMSMERRLVDPEITLQLTSELVEHTAVKSKRRRNLGWQPPGVAIQSSQVRQLDRS